MLRFRKAELKFYQSLNPAELNEYIDKFPENTDYVKLFLEKYRYIWTTKKWIKGKTI